MPINNRKFRRMKIKNGTYEKLRAIKTYSSRLVQNEDNVITVLAYCHTNPQASRSNSKIDLDISRSSIGKFLKKYKIHAYKFISLQALLPNYALQRLSLCEMLFVSILEDANFSKKSFRQVSQNSVVQEFVTEKNIITR